ncbi:MAG: hypothetical protein ACPG5W_11585, partial [Flavobacteriales bacterium]
MNSAQKIDLLHALDAKIEQLHSSVLQRHYEARYGWQNKFIAATQDYSFCVLMASNQCGKTRTGTEIDAYHLLGEYPDDWEGFEFDFPPMCWLLGY